MYIKDVNLTLLNKQKDEYETLTFSPSISLAQIYVSAKCKQVMRFLASFFPASNVNFS